MQNPCVCSIGPQSPLSIVCEHLNFVQIVALGMILETICMPHGIEQRFAHLTGALSHADLFPCGNHTQSEFPGICSVFVSSVLV